MKAAVFEGAGLPLSVREVPDPAPESGELIIKVAHCGICGTDLHRTEGHPGFTHPAGFMLGHEYAGEVVATARDVSGFQIGDRVCALPFTGCGQCEPCRRGESLFCVKGVRPMMGGFAEYTKTNARETLLLPDSLTWELGALVEPLAVALHACSMAPIHAGSRVLILGAGPIGLALLYWCRRLGASGVAMLARSRRREPLARTLGACEVVTSGPDSAAEVVSALAGEPDVVFEATGAPGLIASGIGHVRIQGTVIGAGLCMQRDWFDPAAALRKEVTLRFAMAYRTEDFRRVIARLERDSSEAVSLITSRIPLSAMPAVFESLRSPSSTDCKVLVTPWTD
jgi:(R,R)-butanediol dehydrogenase/meso-butanediol dehydrogenase/diacetyl reductase